MDLPFEESEEIYNKLTEFDIDLIRLISPTTNDLRISEILSNSSGFIYYVSLKGITGAEIDSFNALKERVESIKKFSRIPVVVGFGIKDKKTAKKMSVFSDGVVVGSAIVDIISNEQDLPFQDIFSQISKFVEGIKSSIQ